MKKAVVVVMMLLGLLAVVTPSYADDVDGLWYYSGSADSSAFAAMIRENAGYMLVTFLDCYEWKLSNWSLMYGPFDGTTGNLSLVLTSEANGNLPQSVNATFSITSPTTAVLTINNCSNFPNQDNCPPDGTVGDLVKIF